MQWTPSTVNWWGEDSVVERWSLNLDLLCFLVPVSLFPVHVSVPPFSHCPLRYHHQCLASSHVSLITIPSSLHPFLTLFIRQSEGEREKEHGSWMEGSLKKKGVMSSVVMLCLLYTNNHPFDPLHWKRERETWIFVVRGRNQWRKTKIRGKKSWLWLLHPLDPSYSWSSFPITHSFPSFWFIPTVFPNGTHSEEIFLKATVVMTKYDERA